MTWLAQCSPAAVTAQPDAKYSSVIAELKRVIPPWMEFTASPGLSIALVDGQRRVWSAGFGYTDWTKAHPVTTRTLFSLQSISKTYTTIGVLRAVERGLIKLDAPITQYVPWFTIRSRFAEHAEQTITIRHLLSHWSGLGHEAPRGGNYDDRPVSFEDHVRSIADSWLHFPVGHHFSYSNIGIDLAGYALQAASGKPFAKYMHDEVFTPLGMDSSTYDQDLAYRNHLVAPGYVNKRKLPRLPIVIIPSGGMYSSVDDMAKFVSFALGGGKVGGRQVVPFMRLHEMTTPQFLPLEHPGGYGLGIAVSPQQYGTTVLQHGGGGYGYSACQVWVPEYQVAVIVLSNGNGGGSCAYRGGGVADTALRLMIRAKYGSVPTDRQVASSARSGPSPDPTVLRRLAGTYSGTGFLRFEAAGPLLRRRVNDTTVVALTAISPIAFTTTGVEYTFDLSDAGTPRGVWVLACCGQQHWPWTPRYLHRNDGPDDPPGPNHPRWATLVGRYRAQVYGDDLTIGILVRNGYLYTTWPGADRLEEHSPNLFFTSYGEPVEFEPGRMLFGNRPFVKVE